MDVERLLAAKNKFSRLLKEIFQFDCADLDFGIYRILALRRGELERFLDEDLLPQVERILTAGQGTGGDVHAEITRLEATLRDAGIMDFSGSAKWRELNERRNANPDANALAREVFSDLTTFFGRYYEDGDFLALPRYKGDTYAIPHDGSEVTLHWANSDQYYIKTSERHADYTVDLPGMAGLEHPKLRFRLAAAEADRDNNKTSEKRRYILREADPVELEGDTLVAWFEYRVPNSVGRVPQQKAICQEAEEAILAAVSPTWRMVLGRPASQNDKYTQLGYQLYRYSKKNTADYFVHKGLGAFLGRELDFFIKNEVLFLDDLEGQTSSQLDAALRKVRAIRAVGTKIVDWLDQLERLQRRLFLKKKFILRTDWIVVRAVATDDTPSGWSALVRDSRSMPEPADKAELRDRAMETGSEPTGLLVHGESFQALRLLRSRYAASVKCAYMDPPYNTGNDGFSYKDAYRSSSWLTMMRQVLEGVRGVCRPEAVQFASCDENEVHNLLQLAVLLYGPQGVVENIIWNKRVPKNDKGVGNIHEYVLAMVRDPVAWRQGGGALVMRKSGVDSVLDLAAQAKLQQWDIATANDKLRALYSKGEFDRAVTLYRDFDLRYRIFGKINMSWPNPSSEGPRYEVINPVTGRPAPIPDRGWRWKEETFREAELDGPEQRLPDGSMLRGRIWFSASESIQPSSVNFLDETEDQLLRSIISLKSDGSLVLENMGLSGVDYPKPVSLMEKLVYSVRDKQGLFLDPFAGSGTLAHGVLNLNRGDGGDRRFILVDSGDHFSDVLVQRVVRACVAAEWTGGSPSSVDAVPATYKLVELESYDDTLENVALQRDSTIGALFRDSAALREDYTLRYMLDLESRGSLLNLAMFRRPWNYTIKIRKDGVVKDSPVDLVETFNYLLGLRVERYDTYGQEGLLFVTGTDPNGLRTIVVWRDADLWPNDKLEAKCRQAFESFKPKEFDVVYVNGDNHLPVIKVADDRWKVNLIEETFHQLMFDTSDVE